MIGMSGHRAKLIDFIMEGGVFMKRKIIIFTFLLSVVILLTGCGNGESNNNEESETQKINSEITAFIKNNLDSSWTYSDEKYKIYDDHSVDIIYYNVEDWTICAYDTNKAMVNLNKNNDEILKQIPKVTFTCKKDDTVVVAKTEYENISQITKDNVESNVKYYDANNKLIKEKAKDGFKKACGSYKYKEIFRNPDKYLSKKAKITGEVIQVLEQSENGVDYWVLRVNMTKDKYGYYDDTILIMIEKSAINGRIIEDDIFTFYGLLSEPVTYETIFGASETVPSMLAYYGDLKK